MIPAWVGALDDFGLALLHFEEQLELGAAESHLFAYQLPGDLGPLPEGLLGIATRLVDRSAGLEARVENLLVDTAREQAVVSRARNRLAADRPHAHFIDVQS